MEIRYDLNYDLIFGPVTFVSLFFSLRKQENGIRSKCMASPMTSFFRAISDLIFPSNF